MPRIQGVSDHTQIRAARDGSGRQLRLGRVPWDGPDGQGTRGGSRRDEVDADSLAGLGNRCPEPERPSSIGVDRADQGEPILPSITIVSRCLVDVHGRIGFDVKDAKGRGPARTQIELGSLSSLRQIDRLGRASRPSDCHRRVRLGGDDLDKIRIARSTHDHILGSEPFHRNHLVPAIVDGPARSSRTKRPRRRRDGCGRSDAGSAQADDVALIRRARDHVGLSGVEGDCHRLRTMPPPVPTRVRRHLECDVRIVFGGHDRNDRRTSRLNLVWKEHRTRVELCPQSFQTLGREERLAVAVLLHDLDVDGVVGRHEDAAVLNRVEISRMPARGCVGVQIQDERLGSRDGERDVWDRSAREANRSRGSGCHFRIDPQVRVAVRVGATNARRVGDVPRRDVVERSRVGEPNINCHRRIVSVSISVVHLVRKIIDPNEICIRKIRVCVVRVERQRPVDRPGQNHRGQRIALGVDVVGQHINRNVGVT